MSKVVFIAASLLLVAAIATAGIINPCGNRSIYHGVIPECYFACPQGDTDTYMTNGFYFVFWIRDLTNQGIPDIAPSDFWMIEDDPAVGRDMALCGGAASTVADSVTSSAVATGGVPDWRGRTTMSLTTMAVGGCVDWIQPVCQGYVLQDSTSIPPCQAYRYNIKVRSCDQNNDLKMDLVDLGIFAQRYPPQPYHTCADFDCDADVDLVDLSRFAKHYVNHKCL